MTHAELGPPACSGSAKVGDEVLQGKGRIYKLLKILRVAGRRQEGGKLVEVKWIDVDNGDKSNPLCRPRLVGRELNDHKDDSLDASTPPLEAMRLILSDAATIDPEAGEGEQHEIMTNVTCRAYFFAPSARARFMRLPQDDGDAHEGDVGRLHVCSYGTRDAARRWQQTLTTHLEGIGFKKGRGHPAVFYNSERKTCTLVHGDDYMSPGTRSELDWFGAQLDKKYKAKTERPRDVNGMQEVKILNRLVRVTDDGHEIEADPRHTELITKQTI